MAQTLHQYPNEPIVLVTFEGVLNVDALAAFMPEAVRRQAESSELLYWIIDVRATTTDFGQMMEIIAHQSQGVPGTATNAPNRIFLVGSAQMTRLYQQAMSQPQFGGMTIPILPSLEDALAAVRVRILSTARS